MTMLRLSSVALASAMLALALPAAPAEPTIPAMVDHFIDLKLKEEGVQPAPPADDATLIRRLTLDLVGRVPTAAETLAYMESTDPDKLERLVDRLLASPGFVRHQASELDTMLMTGVRGSIREYLLRAVAENRSWDRIFRELVLPDQEDPSQKSAIEFMRLRVNDLDRLTNDLSVIFFGVNVSCAQCHDHPLVHDWKQDHFFGMKAFVGRTFDNGGFLAERDHGVVKFRTTRGEDRQARLMFLTGKVVDDPSREPSAAEQRKEKERFDAAKKDKVPPPPPSFSARAQLVQLALEPGQSDFFARSIVNRVWHRLFGHGLVMPLDQMHSENPPSHPELLDWLARDTAEHGYDLRRLIRGLVLSRAYARSSRWPSGERPDPSLFAVAAIRPLTPLQLANSLHVATTPPAAWPALEKVGDFEKRIEAVEAAARGFAGSIEQPGENFQIGVSEALIFNNDPRVQKLFLGDNLIVGALKEIPDDRALIDLAVRNVYCRPPTESEVDALSRYLRERADRRGEACRQIVWALLASTEFRFNH